MDGCVSTSGIRADGCVRHRRCLHQLFGLSENYAWCCIQSAGQVPQAIYLGRSLAGLDSSNRCAANAAQAGQTLLAESRRQSSSTHCFADRVSTHPSFLPLRWGKGRLGDRHCPIVTAVRPPRGTLHGLYRTRYYSGRRTASTAPRWPLYRVRYKGQ